MKKDWKRWKKLHQITRPMILRVKQPQRGFCLSKGNKFWSIVATPFVTWVLKIWVFYPSLFAVALLAWAASSPLKTTTNPGTQKALGERRPTLKVLLEATGASEQPLRTKLASPYVNNTARWTLSRVELFWMKDLYKVLSAWQQAGWALGWPIYLPLRMLWWKLGWDQSFCVCQWVAQILPRPHQGGFTLLSKPSPGQPSPDFAIPTRTLRTALIPNVYMPDSVYIFPQMFLLWWLGKEVINGAREEDGSVFPCAVEVEAGLEGSEGRVCRVCGLVLCWESGSSDGSLGKGTEPITGAHQSTERGMQSQGSCCKVESLHGLMERILVLSESWLLGLWSLGVCWCFVNPLGLSL